jgi:hypothetical protein
MDYKLLSSGLIIVVSILMITVAQPSLTQQELNTTTTNSNVTTNTTTSTTIPAINQTELDEWFNSLPDGTYGTIVDSHNFNSSNYPEDYGNSVDENGTIVSLSYPNV